MAAQTSNHRIATTLTNFVSFVLFKDPARHYLHSPPSSPSSTIFNPSSNHLHQPHPLIYVRSKLSITIIQVHLHPRLSTPSAIDGDQQWRQVRATTTISNARGSNTFTTPSTIIFIPPPTAPSSPGCPVFLPSHGPTSRCSIQHPLRPVYPHQPQPIPTTPSSAATASRFTHHRLLTIMCINSPIV